MNCENPRCAGKGKPKCGDCCDDKPCKKPLAPLTLQEAHVVLKGAKKWNSETIQQKPSRSGNEKK